MYAYDRQPAACRDNCVRLAEAMQPLHCEPLTLVHALVTAEFDSAYARAHLRGMRRKLRLRPAGSAAPLQLGCEFEEDDDDEEGEGGAAAAADAADARWDGCMVAALLDAMHDARHVIRTFLLSFSHSLPSPVLLPSPPASPPVISSPLTSFTGARRLADHLLRARRPGRAYAGGASRLGGRVGSTPCRTAAAARRNAPRADAC